MARAPGQVFADGLGRTLTKSAALCALALILTVGSIGAGHADATSSTGVPTGEDMAAPAEMDATRSGAAQTLLAQADAFDAVEDAMAEDVPVEQGTSIYAEDDLNDPFENANRFFFKVNNTLDRYFLRPIAIAYRTVVPKPFQKVARNLINNLGSPVIFANDLLQLEFKRASVTLGRFAINSTFGFLGAADVASALGLKRHNEDFGQTLGVYGVPEGPYLYLPFIGPSPPRDLVGGIVDVLMDPTTWLGGDVIENDTLGVDWNSVGPIRFGFNIIDFRAQSIEQLDELERSSIDFYATIRSLYRQSRDGAIRNGRIDFNDLPQIDDLDDDFDG